MLKPVEMVAEMIVKTERQWKRHVRIKYAKHMAETNAANPAVWAEVLATYGVRGNGSVLPSTADIIERTDRNDERAARTKVAVAEVSEEQHTLQPGISTLAKSGARTRRLQQRGA